MESSAQGSALFLSPEAPYPLAGGGAIRSASLLEYLGRRYCVDMVLFREQGEPDPRRAIPARLIDRALVLNLPRHSRHPLARVSRNVSRFLRRVPPLNERFAGFGPSVEEFLRGRHYSLTLIEHFWCAPYCEQVAPHSDRVVLDLHNVESVLLERLAALRRFPARHGLCRFSEASRDLECRWLPRYSLVLTASGQDAEIVRRIAPQCRVCAYYNALPKLPEPMVEPGHALVFSGNLEYDPNIDAVRYFRGRIWPSLRRRWPDLVWRLVGKNPKAVERYTRGDPRIQATGPVNDALGSLAGAAVAIVPLRAGSGTRIKILEAWAAARPVVSTTLGAEGLPARDGEHLLLADTPEQFVDAVSALLVSAELRSQLGQAGRRLYEEQFTWEAVWPKLAEMGI